MFFQVNYLAHFALVLQLLMSMDRKQGRVVGLSSDAHAPGGSPAEVFPPKFPDDIELLVNPKDDVPGEEVGRGLQRYGVSKLCMVIFIHELNRRLQTDPTFEEIKAITAVAIDPGTLPDSRATSQNVPALWNVGMKYVLNPLQPLLKYVMPTLRKSSTAGRELAELTLGAAYAQRRSADYYQGLNPVKSSEESYDEAKATRLWDSSMRLCQWPVVMGS